MCCCFESTSSTRRRKKPQANNKKKEKKSKPARRKYLCNPFAEWRRREGNERNIKAQIFLAQACNKNFTIRTVEFQRKHRRFHKFFWGKYSSSSLTFEHSCLTMCLISRASRKPLCRQQIQAERRQMINKLSVFKEPAQASVTKLPSDTLQV